MCFVVIHTAYCFLLADLKETSSVLATTSATDKSSEFVAYVHNVSPVKKGRYFECLLQTKDSVVRGVCFSPPKAKRFAEISNATSSVKLKKFKVDTSSNAEDILMDRNVIIAEVTTDFPRREMPSATNLLSILKICVGQLTSVTAKVASMEPIKTIKKNGEELVLQEIMLVDPSGAMKLVLWQEFTDLLIVGETYSFQDVGVKQNKFTKEIFINTSKSDTKIDLAKPFKEVLPVVVQSTSLPVTGEVLGVSKVTYYLGCIKCNKKVDETGDALTNCNNCNLKQKQKTCKKNWYCQVLFSESDSNDVQLTIFQDGIQVAYELSDKIFDVSKITAADIETTMLNLPTVEITYDKKKKTVTSLKAAEDSHLM